MKLDEYNSLTLREASPVRIGPMGEETRTLLFGYDCERRTYHVFQHTGEIHLVIFSASMEGATVHTQKRDRSLPVTDIVPDKRVYPALSDYEFCQALMNKGVHIPFTTYDPERTLEGLDGIAGLTFIDEIDNRATGPKFG